MNHLIRAILFTQQLLPKFASVLANVRGLVEYRLPRRIIGDFVDD